MSEILPGIRARRKAAGLSIETLAGTLGVTRQTIYNWESGARLPAADVLPEIARALGCSIDDLYTAPSQSAAPTAPPEGEPYKEDYKSQEDERP